MVRDVGDIPPRLNILVIGAVDRAEMSAIPAWLKSVGVATRHGTTDTGSVGKFGRADVRYEDQLPDTADPAPDLVVVAQSWPDEFSRSDVNAALGLWPLAQWVVCFGAWCESDGRSRTIWPIGLRVPARAATSRLNHVWDIVTGRRIEPLPITASRDEAFEFDVSLNASVTDATVSDEPRTVLVRSPDPAIRQWLSALCSPDCQSGPRLRNNLVLWDVDPNCDQSALELRRFREQQPSARIVAVMGLPHPESIAALHRAGADRIITKAYSTADLRSEFDEGHANG